LLEVLLFVWFGLDFGVEMGLTEWLPTEERPVAVRETVSLLRPILTDVTGRWTGDFIRLRYVATAE
jgi:hypothetical protein